MIDKVYSYVKVTGYLFVCPVLQCVPKDLTNCWIYLTFLYSSNY